MSSATLNLHIAWASLREAWRHNILALGGLAIGVGAIVAMLALTLIVRREALRQFDRTGLDVLAIQKTSGGPAASKLRQPPQIDLETVRRLAAAQPALEQVTPVMSRRGLLTFAGRQVQADVLGVTAEFFNLNSLALAEGRALTDLDRREPYVVLGRDQAASLRGSGPGSLLGRSVTIEGRVLTIIGVLAPAEAIKLHA